MGQWKAFTGGYEPRGEWRRTKAEAYSLGAARYTYNETIGAKPLRGRKLESLAEAEWRFYAERLINSGSVPSGWATNPPGEGMRKAYIAAYQLGYRRGFKRNAIANTAIALCERGR